ncbi:MAG: hypothetical protein JO332_05155 [Planctomycetaceae bacterium]|nr:hypothetical protein [Planctomycetaceae bacterium]
MRLTLLSFSTLALLAMASCKPPPKDIATKAFVKELHLYFNNLNNEGQARKDDLRKLDAKLGLMTATGSIYSTYTFDENAFIVFNYKCKTCGTKLIITSPETQYLCPSCGHCPYVQHGAGFNRLESPCKTCLGPDGKPREPNASLIGKESFERSEGAQVRPMFELTQENTAKPLIATVRYVRRQWAYDNRGTVDLSSRVIERASVDMSWIPSEQQGARNPGFHRLDATFVGEMEIEYRSGEITVLSRRVEEAVRPWKDLKSNP